MEEAARIDALEVLVLHMARDNLGPELQELAAARKLSPDARGEFDRLVTQAGALGTSWGGREAG